MWHKMLGHLNFDNLVKVRKHHNLRGVPLIHKYENKICEGCQTKINFYSKEDYVLGLYNLSILIHVVLQG